MTIEFLEATDQDQYDVLDIRNHCRAFFTHHTDYITTAEQEAWWSTHKDNGYKIWLVIYRDDDPGDCDGCIAGFCMLRTMYDSGRVYATLALYDRFRGNGIGTAIYKFLVSQQDETWIDVRNDNVASIQAAFNTGFEMHYIGEHVLEMVYRK